MIPYTVLLQEMGVALSAGVIISLFNKCILNNPYFSKCCSCEVESDSEEEISEENKEENKNESESGSDKNGSSESSVTKAPSNARIRARCSPTNGAAVIGTVVDLPSFHIAS